MILNTVIKIFARIFTINELARHLYILFKYNIIVITLTIIIYLLYISMTITDITIDILIF